MRIRTIQAGVLTALAVGVVAGAVPVKAGAYVLAAYWTMKLLNRGEQQ